MTKGTSVERIGFPLPNGPGTTWKFRRLFSTKPFYLQGVGGDVSWNLSNILTKTFCLSAQVSVDPDTLLLFPEDKLLEEGSNVTICLMYGKNLYNASCKLQEEPIHEEQLDSHVSLLKLNNVVFLSDTGTNINCQAMNATEKPFGTVLFVSSKY